MTVVEPIRLLIVPGLRDSGPTHWQSWLQRQFRRSVRVHQRDWNTPDLEAWSARIDAALATRPGVRWVAVAHSFGCLALAHHLAQCAARGPADVAGIRSALFVAPADPARFAVEASLPDKRLAVPSRLLLSETDPWMSADAAREWAAARGSRVTSLGDAGHVNAEAGFGPLPQAKAIVAEMIRRLAAERRVDRVRASEMTVAV
jgi:hypothetical protein